MENILNSMVIPFVKNVALSIIVLLVGLVVIRRITEFVGKQVERSKMDDTLKPFMMSLIGGILKVLLLISVVGILGVETSSFVAVLAAAGFAIGLAFQGSLSNFAGGVLLLIVRPIKVGDYIESNGFGGTVEAIDILNTTLKTPDNKVVYIPNGDLSNSSIVNYSIKETRRVDWKFGVGYEQDGDKVKRVLNEIVTAHPLVLKDPEVFVRMSEHGDSAVVFTARAWVNAPDYFTVFFDVMETVKKRFDEEGISIPYPQMDLHMPK
ncbi:mechanosensitive ion channel family protein [Gudongella sp. DL1XJH-153]|uniref:mechanosensitive ion channel family protein n=1 Tax=Gudongella sp. DL1XJH-153 TaxID=3409804 RepID=UPI003BB6C636